MMATPPLSGQMPMPMMMPMPPAGGPPPGRLMPPGLPLPPFGMPPPPPTFYYHQPQGHYEYSYGGFQHNVMRTTAQETIAFQLASCLVEDSLTPEQRSAQRQININLVDYVTFEAKSTLALLLEAMGFKITTVRIENIVSSLSSGDGSTFDISSPLIINSIDIGIIGDWESICTTISSFVRAGGKVITFGSGVRLWDSLFPGLINVDLQADSPPLEAIVTEANHSDGPFAMLKDMFLNRVVSLPLRTETELSPMKVIDRENVKVVLNAKKATTSPEKSTPFPLIMRVKKEKGELYHFVSLIFTKRSMDTEEFLKSKGASVITKKVWDCAVSCDQTDAPPLAISIHPFVFFFSHFFLYITQYTRPSENQNGSSTSHMELAQ